MNPALYSFWLCPSQEDSQYLGSVIQNLAYEYKSTTFIPHLTLYGVVLLTKDKGIQIINNATQSHHAFTCEMDHIASSEEFFKTIYMQIKPNNELSALQEQIKKPLETHIDYFFNPHISIIYQNLFLDQKKQIKEQLKLKSSYTMSSVSLVYLGENEADVYNIAGWRVDYTKSLE